MSRLIRACSAGTEGGSTVRFRYSQASRNSCRLFPNGCTVRCHGIVGFALVKVPCVSESTRENFLRSALRVILIAIWIHL